MQINLARATPTDIWDANQWEDEYYRVNDPPPGRMMVGRGDKCCDRTCPGNRESYVISVSASGFSFGTPRWLFERSAFPWGDTNNKIGCVAEIEEVLRSFCEERWILACCAVRNIWMN